MAGQQYLTTRIPLSALALATVFGCGTGSHPGTSGSMQDSSNDARGSRDAGGSPAAAVQEFEQVVEAFAERADTEGFVLQQGDNQPFFFPEDCEALPTCYSGNATSPYAFFAVPPAPEGPALAALGGDPPAADGISPAFNLRQDEALVYLGVTPPAAAYFSYTPYLFSRADDTGEHVDIFASLGDSLNQVNLSLGDADSPFDALVAVVVSAHEGTARQVETWLEEAGVPTARHNRLVLPSDVARLGDAADADRFMVLQRFALFEDPAAGDAYLRNPPARVWRVTPAEPRTADPIPTPARLPRGDGTTEAHLEAALDELDAAIRRAHGAATDVPMLSATTVSRAIDPALCISLLRPCQGEVSDTIYSAGPSGHILQGAPSRLSDSAGDHFVVFGVNHEATGKALYSNIVVQNAAKQAGIAAFTSREMAGSAQVYLPDHPDADQLFAVEVARDCGERPYCLEVPVGFPGIDLDQDMMFLGRSYIQPGTSVSAAPDEVLTERVLRFGSP